MKLQEPKEPYSPPQSPNSNLQQTLQAFHFIRLLSQLGNSRSSSIVGSTGAAASRRSHVVRVAAFASMALAVGPRRVWSRGLLRGLGRRRGIRRFGRRRARRGDGLNELRRLVPGGCRMDLCRLLEETSDYIICLLSQVQIMKKIADSCETTKE